jgi:hypothetical protein
MDGFVPTDFKYWKLRKLKLRESSLPNKRVEVGPMEDGAGGKKQCGVD